MEYLDFARLCVAEVNATQETFINTFDIESYKNWFYSQETGLLTFSSGDTEINFSYVNAGTFSTATRTWKWSWDKEDTPDSVRKKMRIVTEFGQKSTYTQLTQGYLESSEVEAWEFAAITAKLLNGIGLYRPVSDHLWIFLVVLEFVDLETANKRKDRYISCKTHGYQRRAFVCKHLNTETKVGFEEAFETYENMELSDEDDLQAWCAECEQVREQAGEWNDESMAFAQIKVVCEGCYFDMKELNKEIPAQA